MKLQCHTSVMFCLIWRKKRRSDSPFHSKFSCNLKNSLNAGSSATWCRLFGAVASLCNCIADGLLFCGDREDGFGRQICANRPSIWRMPLRILRLSLEEMLSKANDRSASMLIQDTASSVYMLYQETQRGLTDPRLTRDKKIKGGGAVVIKHDQARMVGGWRWIIITPK